VLLFAQAAVIFGDGVGVTGRYVARAGAAHAAVIGFDFAPQEQFHFIDGVGDLASDNLGKLAVNSPALRIELLRLLDELVVLASRVFVVGERPAKAGQVAHEVAVGGFGLRGARGYGAGREVAGVRPVDAASVALPAGSDKRSATVVTAVIASDGAAVGVIAAVAAALIAGSALRGVAPLLASRLLAATLLAALLAATLLSALGALLAALLTTALLSATLLATLLLSALLALTLLALLTLLAWLVARAVRGLLLALAWLIPIPGTLCGAC